MELTIEQLFDALLKALRDEKKEKGEAKDRYVAIAITQVELAKAIVAQNAPGVVTQRVNWNS